LVVRFDIAGQAYVLATPPTYSTFRAISRA